MKRAEAHELLEEHRKKKIRFFTRLFDVTDDANHRVLESLALSNDAELAAWLAEEADRMEDFLLEMAKVARVGLYHWVEADLKQLLAVLNPDGGADRVWRLNWPDLDKAYGKHGVQLERLPNHGDVKFLRLFANSWKHNPFSPSDDLCAFFGVSTRNEGEHPTLRRLVGIEVALMKRYDISPEEKDPYKLELLLVDRVLAFLRAVVDAAPFEA